MDYIVVYQQWKSGHLEHRNPCRAVVGSFSWGKLCGEWPRPLSPI